MQKAITATGNADTVHEIKEGTDERLDMLTDENANWLKANCLI